MSSRLTRPTVSSRQKAVPKKPYSGTGKTPRLPMQPKFDWKVNEESGYFELGTPSADDDFYIFNTTLVSCEYFHMLGEGDNENKPGEGSFWTIQYGAFGCNILSDPFELSNEKDSRRTFIGDKATARIRCNGALFHNYLISTTLEFRVLRASGISGHQGVTGVTFAELKGLTKIDVKGLKATLEVVPYGDYGTRLSDFGSQKPELRIVIELSVIPNFFARAENIVAGIPIPAELNEAEENPNAEYEIETHDDEIQAPRPLDSSTTSVQAAPQPIASPITGTEDLDEEQESESDEGQMDVVMAPEMSDYETSTSVAESKGEQTPHEKDQSPRHGTRRAEGGDSLDGAGLSRKSDNAPIRADTNFVQNNESNRSDWTRDELIKFKTQLKEKERAYLQILAEEWSKRDEERESKTSQIIQEHASLKVKLDLKEHQLNEKETSFLKREREMEDSTNRKTFDLTQRLEDSKLRMGRMKDQYQSDIDLLMGKVEAAETEIRRLHGKIQSLELKLSSKEDEIDRLNATRSQWPDMSLERKAMQLEEKNAALKLELDQVRQQRDCYRSEAYALADRQSKLQRQREAEVWTENEVLRTQILMNQQRKDMREERESVREVSEKIEALKEALSKRDSQTHEANLSGNSEKRTRSPAVEYVEETSVQGLSSPDRARINHNGYIKYLNPVISSSMSPTEIDIEIARLVGERNRLIATGTYLRTDSVIRDIDNALTRLASDLMAGNGRISGY